MLLPLLLAACACHHAPEPAASPTIAEAEPPVAAAPALDGRGLPVPSAWASAACEGRAFERQIRFTEGRFAAKDLVAPCPPGTLCVWSGIIDRAGTWTVERRQLRLVQDPDPRSGEPPQATQYPLPATLWLADDGSLTEDGGSCPYARVE
ncbi:MAG: hypothetical protein ABIO70_14955 [Pseudomonadota bacterium]